MDSISSKNSINKLVFLTITVLMTFSLNPLLVTAKPRSTLQDEVEKTKSKLNKTIAEYNDISLKSQKLKKEIVKTENILEKAEKDLDGSVQNLNNRVVNIYKQENFLSAFVLIDSENVHDFFYRLDALIRISKKDAGLIANLQNSQSELLCQLEKLEESYKQHKKLIAKITRLKNELNDEPKTKEAKLLSLESKKEISKDTPSRSKIPASSVIFEKGWASWYGISGYTAAHKTLSKGTVVRVTNLVNGKQVTVKIIDRGPYVPGRVIDLSKAAFSKICSPRSGLCYVSLEVL